MGQIPDTQNLINTLHKTFLLENFREGQVKIIQSILNKQDTLAILPTGGGKSLCYQLPSVLSVGTTIVFSPLISLMKDQVDSLLRRNINATFLNSTLSEEAQQVRLKKLVLGEYKLLYVAPERLLSHTFTNALEKSNISNIIVDEAHCISEWGHNFRPMYLKISSVFNYIRRVPVSCFTATATPEVRSDIIKFMKLENPQIFVSGFERRNLALHSEISENKKERLLQLVKSNPSGSKIIYVGTRKSTVEYAEFLNKKEIPAIAYNGGLPSAVRKEIQDKFIGNEINTIVATNAFGLGIDKPDVRQVIHLDLPTTLESYYQEAGRAGRDGLQSHCYLLYSKNDEKLPSLFIFSAFPDISEIQKVIRGLNTLVSVRKNKFISGNIPDLVNLFNIESTKLRTIFKLLKRKELIEFYDGAHLLEFTILKDNPEFLSISNNFHKFRREIFDFLINTNPETKNKNIILDLKELSMDFGISLESIETEIKSFESLGLIKIKHNSAYTGIKLFSNVIEEEISAQIFKEVEERKAIMISKADAMLDFLRAENCKQGFILNYFGESAENYRCGQCSVCLGEQKNLKELEGIHIHNFKKEISKKKIDKLKIYDELNNLLDTAPTMDLLAKKMKMSKAELANLMQSAIEEGWLVKPIPFISEEILKDVKQVLSQNSNLRLSQIRERINTNIDFPELRVATALARKHI